VLFVLLSWLHRMGRSAMSATSSLGVSLVVT
jgi:hypothetical protein